MEQQQEKTVVTSYLETLNTPKSVETTLRVVRRISEALGKNLETMDWAQFTAEDCKAYRAALLEQKLAIQTVNLYLNVLRGIAKRAWMLKALPSETYAAILDETRNLHRDRRKIRASTSSFELEKLLRNCEDGTMMGKRDAALIAILFGSGLRRCELSELGEYKRSAALNLKRNSITVTGHGGIQREVFLPEGTINRLMDWVSACNTKENSRLFSDSELPLFPAFTGHTDKPLKRGISEQAIYGMLRKRCRDAGIPLVTPQVARRTFVTAQIREGGDLPMLQAQLDVPSPTFSVMYDFDETEDVLLAA